MSFICIIYNVFILIWNDSVVVIIIVQCLSPECYEAVYAKEPLEDGEIDKKREQEFTKCLRQAEKNKKKKQKGWCNGSNRWPDNPDPN